MNTPKDDEEQMQYLREWYRNKKLNPTYGHILCICLVGSFIVLTMMGVI